MTREALTTWALNSGWKMIGGHPSLSKPSRPSEAIVRMVLKATVVNIEIKKPGGQMGEGLGRELRRCRG
jgi:hypothetical protein